jgi:hypothetical protein
LRIKLKTYVIDNHDSNAEDNSDFEYPDEEEVEGSHSRDPWSDSEKQRNNNYSDEDEDEFDQNNYDEEEEDEDIMFKDKTYHEEKFKSNFWRYFLFCFSLLTNYF